jgi:GNAT superfamily N-acetyltransferase
VEKKIIQVVDDNEKSRICRVTLDALPEWFGIHEAIINYEKSVRKQPFWAAYVGECAVGFIALNEHNSYTAEIDVMGILPEYQRKKIGGLLVESAERYCRKRGKMALLVKTLDFSDSDINYAGTRAFYLSMGFIPLQRLDGYWDENNPCLLFGKCLNHELKISTLHVGNNKTDCSNIIQWAETWDWGVGSIVAKRLSGNSFSDWETVIVAAVGGHSAGMCILEKKDSYGIDLDLSLTPYITALYVDPEYRGQRISEKLLGVTCNYARSLGFDSVYLISNEKGFYEKYNFVKFSQTLTAYGRIEPVYRKKLT